MAPRGLFKQKSELLSNNKLKSKQLHARDRRGASDLVLCERCRSEDRVLNYTGMHLPIQNLS